jgi:transcriptional regulator with XRE-family HTH domain
MKGQAPQLTIGERVKFFRERRGMTQAQLAAAAGLAHRNSVRNWENSTRALTDINTIRDLARALGVNLGDLLDDPTIIKAENGHVSDGVPAIRAALVDWRSHFPGLEPQSSPDLAHIASVSANVWQDYQESRYARVHDRLPHLLDLTGRAVRSSRGDERRKAQRLAAETHQLASVFLTKVNQSDLALLAANRGLDLAWEADDSATIGALYRANGHTLLAVGDFEGAASLCEQAGIRLESVLMRSDADAIDLSMWGMLWLVASLGAARGQDRAQASSFLDEAERAAARLGGDANHRWSAFGPTNVVIHRVSAEAELGNPQRAIALGDGLDTTALPVERRARNMFEVARAKATLGDLSGAVVDLLAAEQFAAEQVHGHVIPREIVRQSLRTAAVRRDVLDLAARMGVDSL